MARRKPYTRVAKTNEIRADHVKGMGDVVFKGLQCLNSECEEFIFVRADELGKEFEITCPTCGFCIRSGEQSRFYDYELKDLRNGRLIENGQFVIFHDEYVDEAQEYKYCIVCNTIKPLEFFDRHSARKSGRQGECRLCKGIYNAIKNQTRLTDQHREAAQRRRLYLDICGALRIDSRAVFEKFDYQCFKCGKDLRNLSRKERVLDHTLPAVYLWPLTTENATLLCREHNAEKAEKWPAEYYNADELKRLSVVTGVPYLVLSEPAHYNPHALELLGDSKHVDALLVKYAAYMDEIIQLRNRILTQAGFDFFENSKTISPAWVRKANNEYERVVRVKKQPSKEEGTDGK